MDNPFRIKPGEKLTLDQLLDRYFDWNRWNLNEARFFRDVACDVDLHLSFLCCKDHMAFNAEGDAFFHYLLHHTHDRQMIDHRHFSMESLKRFVLQHNISVNSEKAAGFCFISVDEWLEFQPR